MKKRQSANKADQAVWNPEDLLFISAYGDEASDQREIAFAHFHQQAGDLPTLRVLGWDGGDTPLKLDYVAGQLKEKLHWPQNPKDQEAWRAQWRAPFRHRIGHVIRTADSLAEVLAALARGIRDRCKIKMRAESEHGALTKLYKAFQTALIHDLTEESFADTYAQTITYGLLTAAISRTEMSEGRHGTVLYAENVTDMVPVTNPFLKEMLQTFLKAGGRKGGIDFDELGIQDVVELLRGEETDLPAILRDFGNKTRGEDPVIHFYEHFLSAYNKQLKIQRGVFYTPQPVVSYIVRSVHELLQTEFGLEDGLASTITWGEMVQRNPNIKLPLLTDEPGEKRTIDPAEPFVQILDIATGTATFIVEVIDVIHKTMVAKWKKAGKTDAQIKEAWNEYVPKHLLPRVYGFELMMAPYAIAHMKVGLKLAATGYRFGSDERVRIYLTNSLEPKMKQLPQIGFEALAHEAAAVNEIKWYKRFTVVIGNPPYSMKPWNKNPFIDNLMGSYKQGLELEKERRVGIIDDDYVRFMRYARYQLSLSGHVGLFGLITKNNFLEMAVSRGIRYELVSGGAKVRVINLHGELKKDAAKKFLEDENVFDIRTPVAITVVANAPQYPKNFAEVKYTDFLGSRASKYGRLATIPSNSPDWLTVHPSHLYFYFYPSAPNATEYSEFVPISNIFSLIGSGVKTHKDDLVTDTDKEALATRIRGFLDNKFTDDEIKKNFLVEDTNNWTVRASRRGNAFRSDVIHRYHFKPFDFRYIYYADRIVARTGRKIVGKMISDNLGLCLKRRNKKHGYHDVFVSGCLIDINMLEGQTYVCPLFLSKNDNSTLDLGLEHKQQTNLKDSFKRQISELLGIEPQAEEIFSYIYAILHSPGYRTKYGEDLRKDFPRIPLTKNVEVFRALARLGGELVALHLLESPKLEKPITEFIGGRSPEVEKISWSKNTVWLDKAQTTGFKGVREDVWNFHIGGYQVCEKWLKDRKGRNLSADDRAHYQKIIIALSETIRLMAEIDAVIVKHGGWPLK